MQFKYPEILYALFLLLIPIFIHLFQLRKFKKVAFTNVAFLKKIDLETRKSSKLKHFLILLSRLGVFTALIMAFAQPYFSTHTQVLQSNTILYIDNSLSMRAKNGSTELLTDAVQKIVSNDQLTSLTVITNDAVYKKLSNKELKNQLLSIDYSPFKKELQTVLLQANNLSVKDIGVENNIVLISDFQSAMLQDSLQLVHDIKYSFVQLLPSEQKNICIDSVYIKKQNGLDLVLEVVLKSYQMAHESLSVSLFKDKNLVGKATCSLKENETSKVKFNIQFEDDFNGRIVIEDNLFSVDNELFFSLNKQEKINVLAVGDTMKFLSKIYTNSEFNLSTNTLNQVDYDKIARQNLLILNELKSIPLSFQKRIKSFVTNGGSLVVIPNKIIDVANYNQLFATLKIGSVSEKVTKKHEINSIIFSHPLLDNVFEKKVTNFQYPVVHSMYNSNFYNDKPILQLDNQKAFISEIGTQKGKVYWFSSAIATSNSNFKNSPLIVPIFYNFGIQSYHLAELYYTIGNKNIIAVKTEMESDAILHVQNQERNDASKFIPLQEVTQQKVTLILENNPVKSGLYAITKKDEKIKNIAFNYSKIEGNMDYADMRTFIKPYKNTSFSTSVTKALEKVYNAYKIVSFWKWLVLLALLFVLLEILFLRML